MSVITIKHVINLMSIMLSKRKKIEPNVWFHLLEVQKQAKLIYYAESKNSFCLMVDDISMSLCKISLSCKLGCVHFSVSLIVTPKRGLFTGNRR